MPRNCPTKTCDAVIFDQNDAEKLKSIHRTNYMYGYIITAARPIIIYEKDILQIAVYAVSKVLVIKMKQLSMLVCLVALVTLTSARSAEEWKSRVIYQV